MKINDIVAENFSFLEDNLRQEICNYGILKKVEPDKIILEIRRERRVELILEGFRYDDLMRWKNGKLLESHFKGMYFAGLGEFDLDGDSSSDVELFENSPSSSAPQTIEIGGVILLSNGTDGNLVPFWDRTKTFDESKDYLYPIPSGDIQLNPNLSQNPNW